LEDRVKGLAAYAKLDEASRAMECAAVCSLDLPQRTPAERTPLIEFTRPTMTSGRAFALFFPRTTALAATRSKDRVPARLHEPGQGTGFTQKKFSVSSDAPCKRGMNDHEKHQPQTN
jgi:hypothetical protein